MQLIKLAKYYATGLSKLNALLFKLARYRRIAWPNTTT